MAQERFPNNDTKQHESLCDLHLSSLWSVSGSDWSANIREGCLGATNQPIEKEQSKLRRNLLALGVLGALALVGAARTDSRVANLSGTTEQCSYTVS